MKTNCWLWLLIVICTSCTSHFIENENKYQKSLIKNLIGTDKLSIQIPHKKIWGINGHPLTQVAYWDNISFQIEIMKETGLNFYRVDMPAKENGELSDTDLSKFKELMEKTRETGIQILPLLTSNDWKENRYSNNEAYTLGYGLARGFANRYGSYFSCYALGNELEGYALKQENGNYHDGSSYEKDYDPQKFKKLAYYLKGLSEGIKSVNPNAKIILNCGGWKHYGLFDGLKKYNIKYDIIGYHWYDDDKKALTQVLNKLATYKKDVWITEFSRRYGSLDTNGAGTGLKQQEEFTKDYLQLLSSKSFIKAIFFYELLDEPAHPASEAHYGFTSWTPQSLTARPASVQKPVLSTIKTFIQSLH